MVIVPRIAAVSYLNTIPFIYGIEHEGNLRAELLLSPPSLCAKNFAEHKADIALVPAAAVPSLADAQVVTEYCIGAAGPVRTVVLLSNEPIEKARRVFLDYAQLGHALPGDAFLLIGDKVFDHEGRFAYSYDLAAEWKKATRLPFAFAVWVARKGTAPDLTEGLQHALTFGIEHTYEAILEHGFDNKPYDAYAYLTQNIDYIFDNQKHKALQKFWDSGIKVTPRANPG